MRDLPSADSNAAKPIWLPGIPTIVVLQALFMIIPRFFIFFIMAVVFPGQIITRQMRSVRDIMKADKDGFRACRVKKS